MTTTASTSPSGGVLAVHAHPDDETLTSGALLATWAAAGLATTVVTCTRGERGEVIGAPLAHLAGDPPGLARHREHELAAALAALAVRDHHYLDRLPAPAPARGLDRVERAGDAAAAGPEGTSTTHSTASTRYEDSGMAWLRTGRAGGAAEVPRRAFVGVALDAAAGRLALLLRARRPDLVVTYEPGGGYGHPDHVRAHEVTMRAVALATDPTWPASAPNGAFRRDTPRESFPSPDEESAPALPSAELRRDTLGVSVGAVPSAEPDDPWVPAVAWAVVGEDALRAGYAALGVDPDARALLARHTDDRRATRPLALPDPDGPLPSGAVAVAPDLTVEVGPVRDRVLAALRAHATQVQAVTGLRHPAAVACYALSNLVLGPVLPVESYRWAPGFAPGAGLALPDGVVAAARRDVPPPSDVA